MLDQFTTALTVTDPIAWMTTVGLTFTTIFLAELGDKTQLVCMTLAARHRGWPVFLGAFASFVLLNILAVVFGTAVAQWVPERVMAGIVALLFAIFGIQALRASKEGDEGEEEVKEEKSGHNILVTTFLLIFVAELGDKTQIGVVGIAVTQPPFPVWVGATLALGLSAALGVIVGAKLLQRVPIHVVHRVSGVFFLLLAGLALTKVVS